MKKVTLHKMEVNVETGEVEQIALTAEEIAEREANDAAATI